MIRQSALTLVAAAALATGALAEDPQQGMQNAQEMQGQAQQMGEGGAMSDAMSTNPDRAFVAALVSHARLQQQISELVAQKATNPQIKQLAQDVATDHEQISKQVQQAAQQAGITVHPEAMLPRDQAILAHLQQMPPESLQRNYLFHEAGTVQTNLLLSQWVAGHAEKPEIRQVAQSVATKLQQRSQTIQQLAQAEISSGGAQPAGAQMPAGK